MIDAAMAPDTSANDVANVKIEAPEAPPMSTRDAARLLASLRGKKNGEEKTNGEAPSLAEMNAAARQEMAAAATESPAPAEDAAPAQEQPSSEATEEAEPEQPPIEPPRSWTKEARERWQSLPRDTQEYLAQREQERDQELRRRQNESAEQRKTLEAERQQVEQARQQYEAALPQLMQTLQAQQAGQFNDVRTLQDVERLAAEDWPRYLQWDLQQKKIAAVQQEYAQALQRQEQQRQTDFQKFAREQDALLIEKVPEMSDSKKAAELRDSAMKLLTDELGFDRDELGRAYNQRGDFSLRDHRVQQIILKAALWQEAQEKRKSIPQHAKPVPPVVRPGTPPDKGAARVANVQNLINTLQQSRGVNAARAAAELMRARRRKA